MEIVFIAVIIYIVIFVMMSKRIENKLDFSLISIGALAILLIDQPYIWILIWGLIVLYFWLKD
ncbi:hypothetical protein HOO54_09365 [Bacillus sp. WMMC1349]|uniref:hypothetical protein n=1 Tax=Bacillus sp. WMMC1349 TaxID=2736254 RepID=UPI001552422E|nr:hypothetical protein [Bacillus sp. WMMC1349]NPC92428.1 hypothetical protein [Bacillus sp. WMMC1349]